MSNIGKHLGQKSEYITQYDPTLLVREPRQSNRTYLGITKDTLPFTGFDMWNAYELSCLLDNGCPVSFIGAIVYAAESDYIVESKSIKLYFNSFHMTKLGATIEDARAEMARRATEDLSALLETKVYVHIRKYGDAFDHMTSEFMTDNLLDLGDTHHNLYDLDILSEKVECTKFVESPELLQIVDDEVAIPRTYFSSALMSRCKVTNQPDTGDIYITYGDCDKQVTPESLLKYIASYRGENHFHEEICEAIYKRLYDALGKPGMLAVICKYARRGGFDIVPVRMNLGEKCIHDDVDALVRLCDNFIKNPRQ